MAGDTNGSGEASVAAIAALGTGRLEVAPLQSYFKEPF